MTVRQLAALFAATAVLVGCGSGSESGGDASVAPPGSFNVRLVGVPAGPGSAQAHITARRDGSVLLSWLEPVGEAGHALRFAALGSDGEWGDVQTVVTRERLFVNWADFPSVMPVAEDFWVAHWLQLQPDSYGAYDAIVAVSNDGGSTWSAGTQLNDDETETEHGFVELFVAEGEARAFWLDGRDLANWSFDEPDQLLGVSLRMAAVGEDGTIANRIVVDPMVCDCCQPDVAMAARGPLVAYRDRTEDEIRDIVVRQWRDGRWTSPQDVSGEQWEIEGCPVNGPALAASGEHAALAWFTAADAAPRVRFARSIDGGETFGEPLDLDADGAYGQVDVTVDAAGMAVVSWWRRGAEGGIDLVVRSVPLAGPAAPVRIVAHEAVSQPVDVPQMFALGDGLLLAWSTFDGEGAVKAAVVSRP